MLRHLPQALVKKVPGIGTVAAVADVAAGVAATVKSREEETGLEAIGAIGTRVAQEA